MRSALEQTRHNLEAEIAPILGAEMAAAVAKHSSALSSATGGRLKLWQGQQAKRERRERIVFLPLSPWLEIHQRPFRPDLLCSEPAELICCEASGTK